MSEHADQFEERDDDEDALQGEQEGKGYGADEGERYAAGAGEATGDDDADDGAPAH